MSSTLAADSPAALEDRRRKGGAPSDPDPAPGRPWLRATRIGAGFWAISHVLLAMVQVLSWRLAHTTGSPSLTEVAHSWVRWDALAYVWIAEHGGYPPQTDPTFVGDPLSVYPAWPPFYPIVIKLFSWILPGVETVGAAIVVANLAGLGMLIVLFRFLEDELGAATANRTLLYLIGFPTAFFFAMPYSESLFLLLAVSALYLARRGRWWIAGVLGAMLSATRVIGVLMVVVLGYEYLRQRDFRWRGIRLDVLSLGLTPVGLGLYMLYCQQRYGDPLLFSHAQVFFQRNGFVAPWESVWWSLQFGDDRAQGFQNLLDLTVVVLTVTLLVLGLAGPWKLRRDQFYLWLFGALPFAVAVLQPVWPHLAPWSSMNRYALMVLPVFMVLGKLAQSRFAERLYLFVALPLQAGLMIQYIRFDWAG